MAENLADLFVSYKAVERPKSSSKSSIWKSSSRSGRYSGWGDDDIFASLYDDDIYDRLNRYPYYDYPFYSSPSVNENTGEEVEEGYMGTAYDYSGHGTYGPSGSSLANITDEHERAEKLEKDIKDLFDDAGIKNNEYKISSSYREPGKVGNAGDRSWHTQGYALDIVVNNGNYEDFVRKIMQNKDIRNYFEMENLGILNEWDDNAKSRTGATGKHMHIGPDRAAREWLETFMSQKNIMQQVRYGGKVFRARRGVKLTKEENAINHWSNRMFDSFRKAIKEKYGKQCPGDRADKLALYMTAQAAITSNYGNAKNNNYGNLKKENGDEASFDSMLEYAKAQVNTLDAWDIVGAETLREYVDKLFSNEDGMVYDASEYPEVMYRKMEATAKEINNAIGLSMKVGGRLERIRQIFVDTEKFFKGGSVRKYATSGEIEDPPKKKRKASLGKEPDNSDTEKRISDLPLSELIDFYLENSTDELPKNKNDNNGKKNWTRLYFANLLAGYKFVRDKWDLTLSDQDIKNLALYGLLQGAIESGYGVDKTAQKANNYAGMLIPGTSDKMRYRNMYEGAIDRFRNLCSKYPGAVQADDFWGYIQGLYNVGDEDRNWVYCGTYVNDPRAREVNGWDIYGGDIQGCFSRVLGYLDMKEGDFEKPMSYDELKASENNQENTIYIPTKYEYVDGEKVAEGQIPEVTVLGRYIPNNINDLLGYRYNDGNVTFKILDDPNY